MKKILLFIAIAVAAMSCARTNNEAPKNPDATLSVNIRAHSTADSRVDFDDDNQGGYIISWLDGDKLGAWGEDILNLNRFSEFTMTEFGKDESTFEGNIPQLSHSTTNIRFIHPYDEEATIYNNDASNDYYNTFDADISEQTLAPDGISHLNSSTYMMSEKIAYDGQNDTFTETPTMKHLGGVMDLSLDFSDFVEYKTLPENLKLVSIEVSSVKLPTVATIDMNVDDVTEAVTAKECGTIKITAPDNCVISNDYKFSIPFNIFPFTLEMDDQISFSAKFVDSENNSYIAMKSKTMKAAVSFERAVRQEVNLRIMSLQAAVKFGGLAIEGTTDPIESYEFEAVGGVLNLVLLDTDNNPLYGSPSIQYGLANGESSAFSSLFYDGIMKVTALNENTTAEALTDVLTVTVDGQSRTVNLTQKAAEQLEFTGFKDKDGNALTEVVFDWNKSGSSSRIYFNPVVNNPDLIEGEISEENYKLSNTSNFNAAWNGTYGYALFPSSQNSSDTEYTTILTCTLIDIYGKEHTQTITVKQETSLVANLSYNNFPTAFDTSNQTMTVNSIDFAYSNIASSSNICKFKPNSYLQNTTAIKGLYKIVINKYKNSTYTDKFLLYCGTSAGSKEVEVSGEIVGDVITYAINGNYDYFTFTNTDSTYWPWLTSIKIYAK